MAMETDLPPTQPDNQNNVEDEASSQAHHQNQPSPNDHQGRTGGLQIRVRNKIPQPIKVVPPPNWGMVEDGVYRSGQPTELNLPFMERLNLKGIVWLAPEEPNEALLQFCEQHDIKIHRPGVVNASNAWDPATEGVVLRALDILINPSNLPISVMCNLGRHRTGTVIGCLRRLQRWNLASIFEEYRRYAGPKVRVLNEQFIEYFDVELVPIQPLPSS